MLIGIAFRDTESGGTIINRLAILSVISANVTRQFSFVSMIADEIAGQSAWKTTLSGFSGQRGSELDLMVILGVFNHIFERFRAEIWVAI